MSDDSVMESSHPLSGNPAPSSCRGLSTLTAAALFAFVGLPDRKKTSEINQMMPHVTVPTEASGVVVIPNLHLNMNFTEAVLASDPHTRLLQNYSCSKSFMASLGEYIKTFWILIWNFKHGSQWQEGTILLWKRCTWIIYSTEFMLNVWSH